MNINPGAFFATYCRKKKLFVLFTNTKWWRNAVIKNDVAWRSFFKDAGFMDVRTNLGYKRGWIIVEAFKFSSQ